MGNNCCGSSRTLDDENYVPKISKGPGSDISKEPSSDGKSKIDSEEQKQLINDQRKMITLLLQKKMMEIATKADQKNDIRLKLQAGIKAQYLTTKKKVDDHNQKVEKAKEITA